MSEIEEQLKAMIDARAAVGLKKYGVDLMREDYDLDRWLELAIEECLDKAAYMQRARVMLRANREIRLDAIDGEYIPWKELSRLIKFVAKDGDGSIHGFLFKPCLISSMFGHWADTSTEPWFPLDEHRIRIPGDFRKSLRSRPEVV